MLGVVAIVAVASFAAGVVFHKHVIDESVAVKEHVINSESRIRADIQGLLNRLRSKV